MLYSIFPAANPLLRVFRPLALLAVISVCAASEAESEIDCAAPPERATLGQISPCIQRRHVKMVLWNGKTHKGKASPLLDEPCSPDSRCSVVMRRRFRSRTLLPADIATVEYRPLFSPKRKLLVAMGGITAGIFGTKWLIDQGVGEAVGVFTLAAGGYIGVTGGVVTALAVQPKPVTVQLQWP